MQTAEITYYINQGRRFVYHNSTFLKLIKQIIRA